MIQNITSIEPRKGNFNKEKPTELRDFVEVCKNTTSSHSSLSNSIRLCTCLHWSIKYCLPAYSELYSKLTCLQWTILVWCTYLQWTIVGSTIPMRRCRTLRTNSRKSAGSSGTLWSGQAMYCMCDMCRSSLVCKQEKYNINTITLSPVIRPKKLIFCFNCQNLIYTDRQVFHFLSLKLQYYRH